MHLHNRFVYLITFIELFILGYLLLQINLKHRVTLPRQNVNMVDIHHITYPLKHIPHYFELKPNAVEIDRHYWLPNSHVTYTYNSDGLNDRFDYPIQIKPNIFRIATLGDSFTFGSYVDTKDNWTEMLEDVLNSKSLCETHKSFEVLNFGVRGHDAQYETITYFRKVQKYSPNMIIWFLYINDFNENNEMIHAYMQNHTFDDPTNQWETASQELYKTDKNTVEDLIADNIKKVLDSYKGVVLFVVLPETPKVYIENLKSWTENRQAFIFGTMKNIYSNSGSYLPHDGHPNKLGHQIIADGIYTFLKNDHYVYNLICGS